MFKVKKAYFMQEYYKEEFKVCKKYDFALLELEDKLSTKFGYLGMDSSEKNASSENDFITLVGYPSKENKEKEERKKMQKGEGACENIDSEFFYYKIETSSGQSGGPILKKIDNKFHVIGIHIRADKERQINIGIRLNKFIRDKINSWIDETTVEINLGKPFRIQRDAKLRTSPSAGSSPRTRRLRT